MRTANGASVAAPNVAEPGVALDFGSPAEPSVKASHPEPSTEEFLGIIGRRVRSRRASLHMTRRTLAASSGVSERYLAQLESGRGNMSIALLRKVASALMLPLTELVDENDVDPAGESLATVTVDEVALR